MATHPTTYSQGCHSISLSHNNDYVKNGLDLLRIWIFNNNNLFCVVFYIIIKVVMSDGFWVWLGFGSYGDAFANPHDDNRDDQK